MCPSGSPVQQCGRTWGGGWRHPGDSLHEAPSPGRVAPQRAAPGPGHPSGPTAPSSGSDCCPRECSEFHTRLPKVTVTCSLSSLLSGCSEVPPPNGWESHWECLLKEEMGTGERSESTGALGAPAHGLSVCISDGPALFFFPDPLLGADLHLLTSLRPPASGWVTACPLGRGKAPWTSPRLPVGLKREDNCRGSLGANP